MWIWSVLLRVTSSISRRVIRLRSRCGVAGSDQSLGKSVASWRIRVLCCVVERGVRGGGLACSYSSWAACSWRAARRSSRLRGCRRRAGCRGRRRGSGGGRARRVGGRARRVLRRSWSASSARASSSAWTVSATSSASGVTVSSSSWLIALVDAVRRGSAGQRAAWRWMFSSHALIVGHLRAAALVIADGHPLPAASADREALQQRGAFAGGAGGAVGAVRLGVVRRAVRRLCSYCSKVRYPGCASGISAVHCSRGSSRDRGLARRAFSGCGCGHRRTRRHTAGCAACAAPASGAAAFHASSPLRSPVRIRAGEQQPVAVERLHDRARRPGPLRRSRTGDAIASLHAAVGVEHDLPGRVIDQSDRERHRQLAAAGLGQDPAAAAGRG